MHTLMVPAEGRRAVVRSFWLMLGTGALASVAVIASALGAPPVIALAAGAAVGLTAALVPFTDNPFASRVYHAWNGRIVRPIAAAVTSTIVRVCFGIVVAAAGGSSSAIAPSGAWSPRRSLGPGAYGNPGAAAGSEWPQTGWLSGYLRWARTSGNAWTVALLPFLAVLSLLGQGEDEPPPANIYTLF